MGGPQGMVQFWSWTRELVLIKDIDELNITRASINLVKRMVQNSLVEDCKATSDKQANLFLDESRSQMQKKLAFLIGSIRVC